VRHRTLSFCCICVKLIPSIRVYVQIHSGSLDGLFCHCLLWLCIARHLFMTCCYNSRTQGIEYSIFRFSLASHRRNNTLGFLKFSWSFGSICHQPWFSGIAGAGWWHFFVFNFFEQISELLLGFCFFFFKFENKEANETSRLNW